MNRNRKRLTPDASRDPPSLEPAAVAGKTMSGSVLRRFKTRALSRQEVRQAYNDVAYDFAVLDEILARVEAGEP